MDRSPTSETTGHHLVYFAAERTLLSWMRAAVAVMALGFVIDRFGLFLQQRAEEPLDLLPRTLSFWTGTSLVFLGVLMTIASSIRYWRFAARYHREGITEPGYGLSMAIGIAIVIAAVGILIGAFLLGLAR